MKTRLGLLCLYLALGIMVPTPVFGQEGGTVTVSSANDGPADEAAAEPAREGFLQGGGVKLTEGTYLHPLFELQTGYQSNVFYEDDGDFSGANGSPIIRLSAGGSILTAPPKHSEIESADGETSKPKLALRADLNLTWNQYVSDNRNVSDQSDLGVGALLDAKFNPQGTFTFVIRDGFTRMVNPPAVESSESVDRDRNELMLGGIFKPGGGAIQGYANYTLAVDWFEDNALALGSRAAHTFAMGAKWQWLPKTQFNAEASLGLVSPDSVFKGGSMPLRTLVGVSTLITPTFGTVIKAGYGNGFYDSGGSFNNYLAMVEGRLAVGPVVRVAFGYTHDFADSMLANYYDDHSLYARFSTQVAGRMQLRARGELKFRQYIGVPATVDGALFCTGGSAMCTTSDRTDVLARVDVSADYQINSWLIAGLGYTFLSDTTTFYVIANGDADSGGFVWHELVAKLTAKF